jgi:diaminohydroxyphosphoribosylaminopyrimidine deaminase/5-amino-6-(5-phosphoribosylamino)uracil reductase
MTDDFAAADRAWMAHALSLAANGIYTADPNPSVGCVIVADGVVVGEGWTSPVGGPHAERNALTSAGERARGATAYVTLEPCNHTGRTGPCAAALIDAGLARVVFATRDPNPKVAGGGADALTAAGIRVEGGLLEEAARSLIPGYFMRMTRGRPYIRSKLAISLDGRTALANGVSQWLTSEAARADVHLWRARSSAVLTGVGTVLADDPGLDARPADASLTFRPPARVIVDSRLSTPPDARLLSLPGERLIFTLSADRARAERLAARGAVIERVGGDRRCDLAEVAERLGVLEYNEVWVEAGAELNGALLRAGLIDELLVYIAPKLLGSDARGMFDLGELTSLEQCPQLAIIDTVSIGGDLRLRARPVAASTA